MAITMTIFFNKGIKKNGVFDRKHEYIYVNTKSNSTQYIIFGHLTSDLTPKMVNSSHFSHPTHKTLHLPIAKKKKKKKKNFFKKVSFF